MATGSPFPPFSHQGHEYVTAQANNVFVFPGVGLGSILAEVTEVTDTMFLAAAAASADCVSDERLAAGALYPDQCELRELSRQIAAAVIREARRLQVGRRLPDAEVESLVRSSMWYPEYEPYVPA